MVINKVVSKLYYKDLLTTLLITIVFDLKSNGMKGLVEKMIWLLCFVCWNAGFCSILSKIPGAQPPPLGTGGLCRHNYWHNLVVENLEHNLASFRM